MGKAKARARDQRSAKAAGRDDDAGADQGTTVKPLWKSHRAFSMNTRDIEEYLRTHEADTLLHLAKNWQRETVGCTVLRRALVANTLQETCCSNVLRGAFYAIVPTQTVDGVLEYHSAATPGYWKTDSPTFTDHCNEIKWSDVRRIFPSVNSGEKTERDAFLLKFLVAQGRFGATDAADDQYRATDFAESRAIGALDLHLDENDPRSVAAIAQNDPGTAAAQMPQACTNPERFPSYGAALRVRNLFLGMVESGEIRSAMDRGDVIVTPHPRVYCPAFHYHPIAYRDCAHDRDPAVLAKPHFNKFIDFVQAFGEFFGKDYSSDDMIEKTPIICFESDPEDLELSKDTVPRQVPFEPDCGLVAGQHLRLQKEDLGPAHWRNNGRLNWLSGARRLIMAAIAAPGKLTWYVGPGGSVFANVTIWGGGLLMLRNARLVICPIKFPPNGQNEFGISVQDDPTKAESAYQGYWSDEYPWVYSRPRLRIVLDCTMGALDLNRTPYMGSRRDLAKAKRQCGIADSDDDDEPVPAADPERYEMLYKGVARELCDEICDTVLRRIRAKPRRSAAERRAEPVMAALVRERDLRAPKHRAPREGSTDVADAKRAVEREEHKARLAEATKAKKEAKRLADQRRFEELRCEFVGRQIGGS